jgi:hypothetical protein
VKNKRENYLKYLTTDKTTQTGHERMHFGPNGSYIQTANCTIFHADYGNRSADEIARIHHST